MKRVKQKFRKCPIYSGAFRRRSERQTMNRKTASLRKKHKGFICDMKTAHEGITWSKAKGHLRTITEHKLLVMEHCFRIGLYWQGLTHDLSKYMPRELFEGFRYYEDGKSSPNNGERRDKGYSEAWMHHKGRNRHHLEYWLDYPKPSGQTRPHQMSDDTRRNVPGGTSTKPENAAAAENGAAAQTASWAPEGKKYTSYTFAPYPIQTVQMPRRYVAEMLMDRIAASKNYNKENYTQHDALKYLEKGKSRMLMHPQTYKELHGMLRILDERGEDELVRFVKDYYLKGYPI